MIRHSTFDIRRSPRRSRSQGRTSSVECRIAPKPISAGGEPPCRCPADSRYHPPRPMNPETLEHLLVETGLLTPMQLAFARRDALLRKKRLAPMLIELGLFSDTHFAEWMAKSTSFPHFNPIPSEGLPDVASRVPAAVAREFEVVPVGVDGDELIVATIDPLDHRAIEALHAATGMKVRPVIARYGDLVQVLERLYPPTNAEPEQESNAEPAPFEFGSET